MKLKKLAGLISLLCTSHAWAIEPFIVKDIRVEGVQRTEAGTVFSYLPVKVGDTLDDQQAAAAIRALYATGFFKDVRLEVEQGVLVVLVRERPSIASIELNGIKDFPKDQLKENMKYAGLAEVAQVDRRDRIPGRCGAKRGTVDAAVGVDKSKVNWHDPLPLH